MQQTVSSDVIQPDTLVQAVLSVAAEQGPAALTARTLADCAGVSASSVNYRFGSLERLLQAARDYGDAARFDFWRGWSGRLQGQSCTPADFGSILFAVTRASAVHHRGAETLFWSEVIRAARTGQAVTQTCAVQAETVFWSQLASCCGLQGILPTTIQVVSVAMRFAYGAHGAPEQFDPWALSLLSRFAERACGHAPSEASDSVFRAMTERAATLSAPQQVSDHGTAQKILDTAVRLILEEGPEAVTHRAIAKAAGLSVSSVLHFFGARQAFLAAAFRAIYDRARYRAVPETPTGRTLTAEMLIGSLKAKSQDEQAAVLKDFAAMNGLILFAARNADTEMIARGFLARMGATSIHLLEALRQPRGIIGRLDAQMFSMALHQIRTLSLAGALDPEMEDVTALNIVTSLFE